MTAVPMAAPTLVPTRLLIGGALVEGRGEPRPVLNPTTEETLGVVRDASGEDVETALAAAARAWRVWSAISTWDRADKLREIAAAIKADTDRLVELLVAEVGKPVAEARGEVGATSEWFRYTASLLETMTDEVRYTREKREEIWTRRHPHGVIAAIIPWNYPSALVARKVAPALAAGNAIVLKADEKTPFSALAVAEILAECGLPEGVVNVLTGGGETVGRQLVVSPVTSFVTMTGSSAAGKAILADAAPLVKPVSMELGGKAPFIVLPDADLEAAVAGALKSRHMNCGQVCIAAERTFVHRDVHDAFVEAYVEGVKQLAVGDPFLESTDVGPKVSAEERDKTLEVLAGARRAGARVLVGGGAPAGAAYERGYWVAPTVLVDVEDDMAVMHEEIFGPVTPITSFRSWDEVVMRANDVAYGLSAYVYTSDLSLALSAPAELEFGEVYLNRVGPEELNGLHVGLKDSGYGGDDGPHGLELYFRKQTVYVRY